MKNIQPPIGIFNTVKDWMASKDESSLNGVDMKEIYSFSSVPTTIKDRPPCPPSWYPTVLADGYVAVIPNGRVWGANGAIITPDNHLIWDVSFEGVHITYENHSIFKEKVLPEVSYVQNAADFTHVFSRNYYHWMYEVIPRIHLVQRSGNMVDKYIVNIEPEQPYQSETLHPLGVKKEQLLITNSSFHVQAENLIIPSQPSFPTKWAFDFLRKAFLNDTTLKNSDKKRIYISRKWSRKIKNEDEVMEMLSKHGFIKLDCDHLSVAEQVELFSSAEIIIAAHGAALTNLTFCQPGTKVLEIFSPSYIIPHYWGISSLANLEYYYLIGEKNESVSQTSNGWPGGDDITISIPELESFIKKMHL